jgi:hypothetical protein
VPDLDSRPVGGRSIGLASCSELHTGVRSGDAPPTQLTGPGPLSRDTRRRSVSFSG